MVRKLLREVVLKKQNRFRQSNDISIWLVRHLQLELGLFNPVKHKRNHVYTIKDISALKKDMMNSLSDMLCINDADVASDEEYISLTSQINEMLKQKYPDKSSFEK